MLRDLRRRIIIIHNLLYKRVIVTRKLEFNNLDFMYVVGSILFVMLSLFKFGRASQTGGTNYISYAAKSFFRQPLVQRIYDNLISVKSFDDYLLDPRSSENIRDCIAAMNELTLSGTEIDSHLYDSKLFPYFRFFQMSGSMKKSCRIFLIVFA